MAPVRSHDARGTGLPHAVGIGETHTERVKAARPMRRVVNCMLSEETAEDGLGGYL